MRELYRWFQIGKNGNAQEPYAIKIKKIFMKNFLTFYAVKLTPKPTRENLGNG